LLAGIGVLTLSPRAAPVCPADTAGTFTNVTRAIVPIGTAVTRHFEINRTASGVQLSAPAEYNAQQLPAQRGYNLRLTAPHAGPLVVQATWTQQDGNGGTCTATAGSTLTAASGSRLVIKPPKGKRTYENPMAWKWTCKPDSDPTPATATVRWEIDSRQPPPGFFKGGNAPFKFTRRARAFSVAAGDLCDARYAGALVYKLRNNARLTVNVGRSPDSTQGALYVGFAAFSGNILGPHGRSLALHLGVTLKQGRRMRVNTRACAWTTLGFEVAKGKNVSCWWK
jgi:hypothetical protein